MDHQVEDAERHGLEVPVWLRTVPADEPTYDPDEYRRRWDGFTATGEEDR